VDVGGRPILWHIMKGFAAQGFRDFVLLLGYKGDLIKKFFLDYHLLTNDFTIRVGARDDVKIHAREPDLDWTVTLADTGPRTMTGGRIKRAERYLDGDRFMVTYGDGVADLDFRKLLAFHQQHGKLATVTGVKPPARFGDLEVQGDRVVRFAEKPAAQIGHINGGFFVFERRVLDYLSADEDEILESKPLERLAAEGNLRMYQHAGFWQCMDTQRDVNLLNGLWNSGSAPWKTWQD
jgi:glucose-1-phosphate cytidylyltransferase